jgi:hypothetical protein
MADSCAQGKLRLRVKGRGEHARFLTVYINADSWPDQAPQYEPCSRAEHVSMATKIVFTRNLSGGRCGTRAQGFVANSLGWLL